MTRPRATLARAAAALLCACFAGCDEGNSNTTPSTGATPTATSTPSPGRIVFLGDSITKGYRLSADEAYPALIQQKIDAAALPYAAINAGVNGDTTQDALRRVDALLRDPVAVFVVALGVNDAQDRLPAAVVEGNLQAIFDKVAAAYPEAKLVVAGVALPKSMSPGQIADYGAAYARLADRNRAVLIPDFLAGVAGHRDLNLSDGIHPNAAGYRLVADTMWGALRGIL